MKLCVIFAVVALAAADVSELGYKYSEHHHHAHAGPTVHYHGASGQYSGQSGSLEVIPINLAHVSTTVHRDGEGGGFGNAAYTSNYNQYSSGSGSQYTSGAGSLGGQYAPSATLGSQYYSAGANLGGQYSSGANFGGQYSSGANLGAQYTSGANLGAQYYSSGANLGGQYSGAQYTSGSSGFSSEASAGYQQLINDVLNGKYTVASPSAYSGSSSTQRQKVNINVQPNQAAVTYRHVYFAEAPAEAPVRPRINIDGAIQARKHVKVVFIKTPDQGGVTDQEITLPNLEEEKTQIYVLSKEHNQQPQIRIKAGNAGTASRPEIFFLKYRNEADALKAQQVLRENAGKESFTTGAILTDANLGSGASSAFTAQSSGGSSGLIGGLSSGSSSGLIGGLSSGSGSSGFSGELSSGVVTGLSSGQVVQGAGNTGYSSGLSTGVSSGYQNTGAEGSTLSTVASLPLKETSFTASSSGSKGVTSLYAAPTGDVSSSGYIQ